MRGRIVRPPLTVGTVIVLTPPIDLGGVGLFNRLWRRNLKTNNARVTSLTREEALVEAKNLIHATSLRFPSDTQPVLPFGRLRSKLGPWQDLLTEVLKEAEDWGVEIV